MRGVVAAGLTGLLCCGCAQEPDPASAWPAAGASWVLEPRELGLGQTAWLERVVVTPPGHVPHPFVAPADPPGVWILDIEALPAEESATRWIHRTRILLRARAVGEFTWPERTLDVAGPNGGAEPLVLPALALRVASILPELPDRSTPFGLRLPPERGSPAPAWAALAGAAAGLAAGISLARRPRRRSAPPLPAAPDAEGPDAPWSLAHQALARAEQLGAGDPLRAAHVLSPALRHYLAARFGVDAVGHTAEELAASDPPFALRSRWPGFTALLAEVDALRFQEPGRGRSRAADALPEWLARARALVDDSIPPEHRA